MYEFTKKGSGRTLTNVGFLRPGIETGQILDLAYKRGKIYVATSDRRLYQYNGVSLAFEHKYELGVAIRELNSGGGRADRDRDSNMHNRLLGVSQEGGLVLMDIGVGGLSEQAVIGHDTCYGSTFVADADNDGIDDIIAYAPNGKIHIYDWYSRLLKYEFACPGELYCMYCDDTDGDGHLEIFAGARNNQIYVLGVDPSGGLRVKWKYQTEHRAVDLWVGNAQEESDKRVVVALANGGLQVFKIHRPQEVNRGVAEAFRHLPRKYGANGTVVCAGTSR